MRWWTLGLGGLLAAGGLLAHLFSPSGAPQALHVGFGAGALLAACAGAMSDMKNFALGDLAVKVAWATCVGLAGLEWSAGWDHKTRPGAPPRERRLGATGWLCAAFALAYMRTGMSGLWRVALPLTPGAVFKSPDAALKQKVWELWGYGDAAMR